MCTINKNHFICARVLLMWSYPVDCSYCTSIENIIYFYFVFAVTVRRRHNFIIIIVAPTLYNVRSSQSLIILCCFRYTEIIVCYNVHGLLGIIPAGQLSSDVIPQSQQNCFFFWEHEEAKCVLYVKYILYNETCVECII